MPKAKVTVCDSITANGKKKKTVENLGSPLGINAATVRRRAKPPVLPRDLRG